MIATFTIEIVLALYVLFRYHTTTIMRLIVVALASLAMFQVSEYFVCGGLGADGATWSRIGFAAITMLPPLGLHILQVMTGNPSRKLVVAAYGTMAGFMAYFLIAPNAFVGHECTGNYVIFQIGTSPAAFYGAYYYGWLLTALVVGFNNLRSSRFSKKVGAQITALMAGYLVFLVPTGIANSVKPETRAGIPSIMCGFAVIFALILAPYIAPRVGVVREKLPLKLKF